MGKEFQDRSEMAPWDVFKKAMRNAFTFDALPGPEFIAKVLTRPIPLNPMDVNTFFPIGGSAEIEPTLTGKLSKFVFIGRIEELHSPFLIDPCDLSTGTPDQQRRVFNLINDHTRFYSMADTIDYPAVGDFVTVRLDPGTAGKWDLQRGGYVGLYDRGARPPAGLAAGCQSIEDMFGSGITGFMGDAGVSVDGENANALRKVIELIPNVAEKNSNLDTRADITEEVAIGAAALFNAIGSNLKSGESILITAGNDASHTRGRHFKGIGMDVATRPRPNPDSGEEWSKNTSAAYEESELIVRINHIMSRFASANAKFRFIDEYNYPTGYASGPHFHFSYSGGSDWENPKTREAYYKYVGTTDGKKALAEDTSTQYWEKHLQAATEQIQRYKAAGAVASSAQPSAPTG